MSKAEAAKKPRINTDEILRGFGDWRNTRNRITLCWG